MSRTRLYIKPGVNLDGMTVEAVRVIETALHVWAIFGHLRLTITSGTEGQHTAANSGHTVDFQGDEYYGFALDLRTRDLPGGSGGDECRKIAEALRSSLGPGYDVVIESNHIHVEFDRRSFRGGTP